MKIQKKAHIIWDMVIGVPKQKEKKNRAEAVSEDIVAKIFPKLMKGLSMAD